MSLADYEALDLRPDDPVAADLSARLKDEAVLSGVPLSAPYGAGADSPALFTPAMLVWYRSHVVLARSSALADVKQMFEQEAMPSGNRGFLMEIERDRIEQEKQRHLHTARHSFYQRKDMSDLGTEIERLHAAYDHKRSEHGRDAGSWNPAVKYGGIVAIMLLEFPLNLSSFLKIDFLTPALATASVCLIAILFAFSSHLIGRILRQWGERFGDTITARLKADSYRQLAVGLVLFAIGAAAIVFSRSYLVAEALSRQSALGEEGGSTLSIYGIALIGNLAVYAASVTWVMFNEDPVPDFAEERRRLDLLKAKAQKAYKSGIEREQQQRILEAQREFEKLKRREADQAKTLRNYTTFRARYDAVCKHDARVLALLDGYRNRLVAEALKGGVRTRFTYDDLTSGNIETKRHIDGDDYLSRRLALGSL